MTIGRTALCACLAVVGLAGQAWSQPSAETTLPVARLGARATAFSEFSGLADSLRLVVRDSAAWRTVWNRINQPFIPPPSLPPVDFARTMIVVVSLGREPSGGYDVVIDSARSDGRSIDVVLHRITPGGGCPVEAVVTAPVDVARLPATPLPVRFRDIVTTSSCTSAPRDATPIAHPGRRTSP
jgi:hypothetical protein